MKTKSFLVVMIATALVAVGVKAGQTSGGSAGTAVLSITSGLATQTNGANPLGSKPLILMKESFGGYLQKKGMFQGPPGTVMKESPLAVWAYSCRTGSPACKQALYDAQSIFVTNAYTDANGRATLPPVPPGTFYLFAQAVVNNQHLIWDLRVDLKAGPNSVLLDQRNITPLDAEQTRTKTAANPPADNKAAATNATPSVARPIGPKNSVLNVSAIAETRQPLPRTIFYLLDDDFENILRRAGFKEQMFLGQKLPLLNSFEVLKRWKALKEGNPMFSIFESMTGESVLPDEIEEQYAIGMKALADHTVATIKTNIYGKAATPSIPAGTYYIFGTVNEFVTTGASGTVSGGRVTLNDTGYQKATIWNLKVTVKAGSNSVILSPDNAAFEGS